MGILLEEQLSEEENFIITKPIKDMFLVGNALTIRILDTNAITILVRDEKNLQLIKIIYIFVH
ncbi:MAG: hypothetical protein LBT51_03630 [Fusobacteriaceae bacterium]|nr:hypothetical protein [Fusobacteriaceae bacterium]